MIFLCSLIQRSGTGPDPCSWFCVSVFQQVMFVTVPYVHRMWHPGPLPVTPEER
jgi:hypothetical protein